MEVSPEIGWEAWSSVESDWSRSVPSVPPVNSARAMNSEGPFPGF